MISEEVNVKAARGAAKSGPFSLRARSRLKVSPQDGPGTMEHEPLAHRRYPVTVRAANGGEYHGAVARSVGERIFIECRKIPAVGMEVVVNLTGQKAEKEPAMWEEIHGTVAWLCPYEDLFGFKKGFGVRTDTIRSETASLHQPCHDQKGGAHRAEREKVQ